MNENHYKAIKKGVCFWNRYARFRWAVNSDWAADLSGANLSRVNLYWANLSRANLSRANLCGANLCEANLRGANLYGADLCGAYLYGANLYGANLRGANLYGADLCGADLRRVDLKYSSLPLWCGGMGFKADSIFLSQLAYHIANIEFETETDTEKEFIALAKEVCKKFDKTLEG